MKQFLLLILFVVGINFIYARHIKGGWIQYEYQGAGAAANISVYKITVYVFRDCSQTGPMPSSLGIYDAVTYAAVKTITGTTNSYTLLSNATKGTFDPCLSTPYPTICYLIYTYTTTVTLDDNTNGYIIAASDANRVSGIINISNSSSTGISFTATIPGTINSVDYHKNTSPFFAFKDTAVICYSSSFTYQFAATDVDGDSLSYALGDGINGTQTLSAPPYSSLTYSSGYNGTNPFGTNATIDPVTGLISGKASATTGEYVIAVYVTEWRNGIKINSTKKELQITVANCSLSAASLKTSYINCGNYTFTFQNESTASSITSYLWDFGTTPVTTSTNPSPTYAYPDTGTFTLKLTVANSGGCKDSATSTVKVYPGFTPSFVASGSCYQSPFQFTDNSYVKYGSISSWIWNFGDVSVTTDTSSLQNPSYQYSNPGTYTASLNITSTKGCTGTYNVTVTANNKPAITLPFKDTLICSIDSLPLIAQTSGTVVWTPNYNIINPTSNIPIVFPKDTTTYTVTVSDKGCIDSAKIKVNVLQFISVKFLSDTNMCKTDSITLNPVSYALSYVWKEVPNNNSLNNYSTKNPLASPPVTTTYYVKANLGYCQDSAHVTVYVAPYPQTTVSADTSICFGTRATLNASIVATSFSWSPTSTLINTNTLHPTAGPTKTTNYILTVKDTSYCPKSVSDTVTVTVIPIVTINAGNDTSVVANQPLQLTATGDTTLNYSWQPFNYFNNSFIYNPVATFSSADPDSVKLIVTATTKEGCSNSDYLWVKVFKMNPDILVPSGFTPNGDGRNDILKPILIGIKQLTYFNLYNRWGQMIYSTTTPDKGWDGNINGKEQPSGAYVYMAQGIDYLGNTIFRKGNFVLIR
ncbi:MAG: hypothetical protein C0459_05165 [Chitinophaga sp.]|jgi:gliding motility-associated-like protein|nr:hypothetical protein [Chitinophaga sp.]